MTVYVTEHSNIQRLAGLGTPITLQPQGAPYVMSSAAAVTPSSLAQYVRISADVGTFFGVFASSTLGPVTSTNAFRIPANAPPELFAIPPGSGLRLMAAST